MPAARTVAPAALRAMIVDGGELALLDVREQGAFGRGHLLFASCLPLSRLELMIDELVPRRTVRMVLCDGGEGAWDTRAGRIAAWTRRAGGRLRVMPGGGVTDEAIAALARRPEVTDLHVGRLVRTPATAEGVVDAAKVAAVVQRLADIRKPG